MSSFADCDKFFTFNKNLANKKIFPFTFDKLNDIMIAVNFRQKQKFVKFTKKKQVKNSDKSENTQGDIL